MLVGESRQGAHHRAEERVGLARAGHVRDERLELLLALAELLRVDQLVQQAKGAEADVDVLVREQQRAQRVDRALAGVLLHQQRVEGVRGRQCGERGARLVQCDLALHELERVVRVARSEFRIALGRLAELRQQQTSAAEVELGHFRRIVDQLEDGLHLLLLGHRRASLGHLRIVVVCLPTVRLVVLGALPIGLDVADRQSWHARLDVGVLAGQARHQVVELRPLEAAIPTSAGCCARGGGSRTRAAGECAAGGTLVAHREATTRGSRRGQKHARTNGRTREVQAAAPAAGEPQAAASQAAEQTRPSKYRKTQQAEGIANRYETRAKLRFIYMCYLPCSCSTHSPNASALVGGEFFKTLRGSSSSLVCTRRRHPKWLAHRRPPCQRRRDSRQPIDARRPSARRAASHPATVEVSHTAPSR